MFFQKRKRPVPPGASGDRAASRVVPESYFIGPDELLKGHIVPRGRKKVRQFAVLVDTRVRIVTTGDVVDPTVYRALVAAGAVKPPPDALIDDVPPPASEEDEA